MKSRSEDWGGGGIMALAPPNKDLLFSISNSLFWEVNFDKVISCWLPSLMVTPCPDLSLNKICLCPDPPWALICPHQICPCSYLPPIRSAFTEICHLTHICPYPDLSFTQICPHPDPPLLKSALAQIWPHPDSPQLRSALTNIHPSSSTTPHCWLKWNYFHWCADCFESRFKFDRRDRREPVYPVHLMKDQFKSVVKRHCLFELDTSYQLTFTFMLCA